MAVFLFKLRDLHILYKKYFLLHQKHRVITIKLNFIYKSTYINVFGHSYIMQAFVAHFFVFNNYLKYFALFGEL